MKLIVTTFLLIGLAASAQAQFQNKGFEEWDQLNNPVGWYCPNVPGVLISVEPSDVASEGSHSAKMNCTELADASFMIQGIPNVAVVDQIYLSLQYANMTEGLQGAWIGIGYVGGTPVDATGEGGFLPAGAGFQTFSMRWDTQVQEFDSLHFMIALTVVGDEPVVGSVLIDNVTITGINGQGVQTTSPVVPMNFGIESVYPNPFNGDATIRLATTSNSGQLTLFDASGRIAGRMNLGALNGVNDVHWSSIAGKSLPAGRYTIIFQADGKSVSAPAVYLK